MNIKWHHRITHFPYVQIDGSVSDYKKCNDFCSYTRWFMWKLFVAIPAFCLLVGAVAGWYASCLAAFVFLDLPFVISDGGDYGAWLALHILIIIVIAFVGLILLWDMYNSKLKEKEKLLQKSYDSGECVKPEPKPDGFLLVWYKSFKGKYCPPIEY